MNYKKTISKDEINNLPAYIFNGRIEIIDHQDDVSKAIEELQKHKVLGFDTETRAAFKKGERYDVSLLQLATDSTAYLFRLNRLSNFEQLFSLLSDPNIVKAGVAVRDDIIALQKLLSFEAQNFVDLAVIAKENKIEKFGLRALVAILLGKRLSKKAKISNWDREKLTDAQIHYAACDGVVGYEIYCKFFEGA